MIGVSTSYLKVNFQRCSCNNLLLSFKYVKEWMWVVAHVVDGAICEVGVWTEIGLGGAMFSRNDV